MSLRLLLLATVALVLLTSNVCLGENRATSIKNDFVGTAVLMPNARRSRLSRDFVTAITDESPPPLPAATNTVTAVEAQTPPSFNRDSSATTNAVVPQDEQKPTVAADGQQLTEETYREYEHLLKMDTKNFNEKQKQLFEQIVERVARLSGSTDQPTTVNVDPEIGESRGSKQRLTKARLTTTSSPSSATTPTKNKYSSSSTSTSTATTTKTKPFPITIKTHQTAASAPGVTAIPAEVAKPFAHKFKPLQTNISPVSSSAATKVGNVTEVIFGNITTTSIVDSLSNDNGGREDILSGKKRPATTMAAATVQTTAETNKNKVRVKWRFLRKFHQKWID